MNASVYTPGLFEEDACPGVSQKRDIATLNRESRVLEMRPYQREAMAAVSEGKRRGVGRGLIVQATGTGKTVLASGLVEAHRAHDPRPALFVAHREELLTQAQSTFAAFGMDAQIERGDERAFWGCDVVVASLATIARKGTDRLEWLARKGPSLLIYDEAHHAASEMGVRMIERFGGFDRRAGMFLGLTATPHRLDNKPLDGTDDKALFEERLFEYGLVQAIQEGWLSPLRAYVIQTQVDLSRVSTTGGDFKEGELGEAVNTEPRTDLAIKHWKELAQGRPTIGFCVTIEHAQAVAEGFTLAGVPAECVHGGMKRQERAAVLDRFRSGRTQVLTSCQLTTEGFDHRPTSCILMLRPTKSWALYAQMVGRGTRLSPETGKEDCLVLDVVDLSGRHNLASAPGLVGLPSKVDLQGASLTEALEEMAGLEETMGAVPIDRGTTWKEALSKAREVPLFAIETPAAIKRVSRCRWLAVPGGFHLNAGKVTAMVTEDSLGWSVLFLHADDGVPFGYTVEGDLSEAIQRADGSLRKIYPECVPLANEGQWTRRPASEKTLVYCNVLLARAKKRLGHVPSVDLSTITQGEAGHLITQLQKMLESGKLPASLPTAKTRR